VADLYLFAVSVQGDLAKPSILWALQKVQEAEIAFDVCILTRGGGSQEDLWIFNDEDIVRAVAGCRIPVVSAIGHQIDTTLCDFAADHCAPTPSAAAELVTPDVNDILYTLSFLRQSADRTVLRNIQIGQSLLSQYNARLSAAGPEKMMEKFCMQLQNYQITADHLLDSKLSDLQARLDKCAGNLDLVNPLSILKKGYARVTKEMMPVKSVSSLLPGDHIEVAFSNGQAHCEVLSVSEEIL